MTRMLDKTQTVDLESITSAAQLPDDYIIDEMIETTGVSFKFWFLTLDISADLKVPSIDITAKIFGVVIGRLHLDPKHPKGKIGGSVRGFKAVAKFELKTNPTRLLVEAELCALGKCKRFEKEIKF